MSHIEWLFQSIPIFYGVHALLSIVVAYVGMIFLKKKYLDREMNIFIFLWCFSFVMPIVGYFMVIWIVYYLLNVKYELELKGQQIINMEEFFSDFPKVKRVFGESGVRRLSSLENEAGDLKLKAVTALSDNSKREDINMIKKMLGDRDDEVRLYSFSIINKMERSINNKIHETLKEFNSYKENSSKQKIESAVELAHLYWDLVYYQLSDSNLRDFIIREVERYSRFVLYYDSMNMRINLLMGKLYLSQGKYNNAQIYITVALKSGINRDFIIPYLAEIFYERKEYEIVKKLLEEAEDIEYNSTLYPIFAQWRDNNEYIDSRFDI